MPGSGDSDFVFEDPSHAVREHARVAILQGEGHSVAEDAENPVSTACPISPSSCSHQAAACLAAS